MSVHWTRYPCATARSKCLETILSFAKAGHGSFSFLSHSQHYSLMLHRDHANPNDGIACTPACKPQPRSARNNWMHTVASGTIPLRHAHIGPTCLWGHRRHKNKTALQGMCCSLRIHQRHLRKACVEGTPQSVPPLLLNVIPQTMGREGPLSKRVPLWDP